ncbi:FtsK/SpoIIIE domain-containing protein [Kitasatospora mediocidica]|uniref:FtsK/SpoIIIE domain-containing protein n=1 Tax=Kitasatospora mediocidica TaxID=58352 RepID=UPI00055B8469|nr:FtsK/SpoIIIE domain-containing protein [Kitasatospora mediocidica]
MAQYIGFAPAPADLPGPRPTILTVSATTTDNLSPTVTNQDSDRNSPRTSPSSSPTRRTRFLASCAAVALRAATWVHTYRYEMAPGAAVSVLTMLGWWQHTTHGAADWATGYTVLGAGAALAASHGLKHKHDHLYGTGAGVAIALGDVAAATAAGPGPVSFVVFSLASGLAYVAYVPWLAGHRKTHSKPTAQKETTQQADIEDTVEPAIEAAAEFDELDDNIYEEPQHNPFGTPVIPYADDESDDVRAPIRLGWDENGQRVPLTLLYRHTLVAGASDFGKSGLVNLIIKKLLKKKEEQRELFGIDMKPGSPELGPWEPKMRKLARTPEEARDLLQLVRAECDRRGAFLADLSASSMASGRGPVRKWIPGVHGPAWWIITDELAELIRQDEELRKREAEARKVSEDPEPAEQDIATAYESLLAIARFLGIQFVSATQQPSAKVFGGNTDARGNYANRISTRVGEAGHTPFIFGRGCTAKGWKPEDLQRPGEFYIGAPELPLVDPPKCQAEYVTDEDIAADVGHYFQAGHRGPSAGQSEPPVRMLKSVPVAQAAPAQPKLTFPDGSTVGRNDWPDLYRVFCRLCEEQGFATKDDLVKDGPFDSRDTVRRALDAWLDRGVLVRKQGRAEQFHLPTADSDD